MESLGEHRVHLHPSDPVEDDGPLTSFHCTQETNLRLNPELCSSVSAKLTEPFPPA